MKPLREFDLLFDHGDCKVRLASEKAFIGNAEEIRVREVDPEQDRAVEYLVEASRKIKDLLEEYKDAGFGIGAPDSLVYALAAFEKCNL